jgi:hypothetical protein
MRGDVLSWCDALLVAALSPRIHSDTCSSMALITGSERATSRIKRLGTPWSQSPASTQSMERMHLALPTHARQAPRSPPHTRQGPRSLREVHAPCSLRSRCDHRRICIQLRVLVLPLILSRTHLKRAPRPVSATDHGMACPLPRTCPIWPTAGESGRGRNGHDGPSAAAPAH